MAIIHTFDIDNHFRAICFSVKSHQMLRCELAELPMLNSKYENIHILYFFQRNKAVA